jgi:hypothetical protein
MNIFATLIFLFTASGISVAATVHSDRPIGAGHQPVDTKKDGIRKVIAEAQASIRPLLQQKHAAILAIINDRSKSDSARDSLIKEVQNNYDKALDAVSISMRKKINTLLAAKTATSEINSK